MNTILADYSGNMNQFPPVADPEPKITPELDALMKRLARSRKSDPADYEPIHAYFAVRDAWKLRMEKRGRKISRDTVYQTLTESQTALIDWLKATNAPEEVLDIARGYRALQYAYLVDSGSEHSLTVFGQAVPIMRRAVKVIRALLGPHKPQD